jgi:hypothetical protein
VRWARKSSGSSLTGWPTDSPARPRDNEGNCRKTVVSLDKHFIGKETTPLDDDNELIDDGEEPVLECNELVLRSDDRNLQPLVDAGIEFRESDAWRRGAVTKPDTKSFAPRLTYAEINSIRSSVELQEDGTLAKRTEIDDLNDVDVRAWRTRLKTWRMLCSFGRFSEVAEASGMPLKAIDYAARYGDHDDKLERAKLYGRHELPSQDFDWTKVREGIETLSGWKARQAELRKLRRAAIGRSTKHKTTSKTRKVLTEIQTYGYEVMVDAIEGERPSNNDAVRKTRQRRKTGLPSRYTPEMQFKKFIKEAREANFNIFGSEIDPGGFRRTSNRTAS